MFGSIFDDIKRYLTSGNMISKIIIINGIVFVTIIFVKLGLMSTGNYQANLDVFQKYIALNPDMWFNLSHPWVFITHAFTHFGLFHVLFNMLLLYWFGTIVGDLIGDDKVLPIYIYGIIGGIIFFWLSSNYLVPNPGVPAIGASAGVLAIIVAAGFISPDYTMNLILIGPVKIKYIVLVLLVIDLLAITNLNNTGGHFAHLGGAIIGGGAIVGLRNGRDILAPMVKLIDRISAFFERREVRAPRVKSPLTVSFKADERRGRAKHVSDEDFEGQSGASRLDEILDKIKQKGIKSLSKEEKQFLDNQSKKN